MTVQKGDFVELQYIGKLPDGTVFDSTDEEVAKKHGFFSDKKKYGPVIICVGEQQILPGLDQKIAGKEIDQTYLIHLTAAEAFGKRDITKMKIVPLQTFTWYGAVGQP